MAPDWTNQIPNYAICNFFYAFYVVYAVIFVLAVIQILYILSTVKKFDLNNGIMLASGFFTTALALVLTLFHYLVCDRALMHSAIKDVEGFRKMGKASVCDQGKAKCLEKNKGKPSVCNSC
jgi:hypothetical protein